MDVTPKAAEQNLIVPIGKSEAEATNSKRLRSRLCTVKASYRQTRSIARPLRHSELLVVYNVMY